MLLMHDLNLVALMTTLVMCVGIVTHSNDNDYRRRTMFGYGAICIVCLVAVLLTRSGFLTAYEPAWSPMLVTASGLMAGLLAGAAWVGIIPPDRKPD